MKGNAKRNGEARTREVNPFSTQAKGKRKTKGQRPMTKAQAKLARRQKQFELYEEGDVAEKRKTDGSYHKTHRPGSMSK